MTSIDEEEEQNPGQKKIKKKKMGYVLRVRTASFFAGAAVASAMGIYALQQDYKNAHRTHSQQVPASSPSSFDLFF